MGGCESPLETMLGNAVSKLTQVFKLEAQTIFQSKL